MTPWLDSTDWIGGYAYFGLFNESLITVHADGSAATLSDIGIAFNSCSNGTVPASDIPPSSITAAPSTTLAPMTTSTKTTATTCATITNTPIPTNQILQNPSFEYRDASCNVNLAPWTTVGGYANSALGALDGVIYFTIYTNSGYLAQTIASNNSSMYGNYSISMFWRPTYWSGGSAGTDTCNQTVTWNGEVMSQQTLGYGSPTTYGWTNLVFTGLEYTAASGGMFEVAVECTNAAWFGSDYDNFSMTLQS